MPVTIAGGASAVMGVTAQDVYTVVEILNPLPQTIVMDDGEGGPNVQDVANAILGGQTWISYGGYPFFWAGGGDPTTIFRDLGVQFPNGTRFRASVDAPRVFSCSSMQLPPGWVSPTPPILSSDGYWQWPVIGVKSKGGWWFYCSGQVGGVTATEYGNYIKGILNGTIAPTATVAQLNQTQPFSGFGTLGSGTSTTGTTGTTSGSGTTGATTTGSTTGTKKSSLLVPLLLLLGLAAVAGFSAHQHIKNKPTLKVKK